VGEAVRCARAAGIANLSLDLMFWLPGQTADTWLLSVEEALTLEPDHLSMYLLELYPNAPLREAMARAGGAATDRAAWAQVADDQAADMYLDAFERLDRSGLEQYEISNAARPGRQSRHNLKYWTMGDWRGFGCGAHSTVRSERWQNVAGTNEYIDRITQGQPVAIGHQPLSAADQQAEALFTGLRLSRGIDCGSFLERFGSDPWETYGAALGPATDAGLVWRRLDAFGLTRAGMLVSNEIGQLFV
jgi:oxygen-independent coproporphyrinogen-3 oxidase